MISDWLSYSLADFVMVSARVHDRQIELYNADLLGVQALSLGFGVLILWLGFGRGRKNGIVLSVVLGLAWLLVAWNFLWLRYGEVNFVARYAAPAFALQGVALVATAFVGSGLGFRYPVSALRLPAIMLVAVCVLFYPVFTVLVGRPVQVAEFFAMMPDPTALATLCVLVTSRNPVRFPLMVIPAAWCAVSAALQYSLDILMAWVVIAVLAACFLLFAIVLLARKQ